ncbi:MAG: pyrroloquinoline quinone biosynthesis protein PqqB [Gammaproteobacteria bacterium]|nr:pyrroloquinoline quinone biosynthesis protein PqqB [Gammaproteobacteria bacterium]MBV9726025.1 pyrroloquinoline quinone biosynthesis protein PqqB [Gammaproteobacteria bacterium]
MKLRVLGSAAGGGFPQWNCNCRNCSGVRTGTLRALRRTQSSVAVCGEDAASWVLINASPDILAQLAAHPDLQPARAPRDTAIAAIVLVDGQIDHTTGLFMLRESTRPLLVWCTDAAGADLTRGNPIFAVLQHYCGIEQRPMKPDGREFAIDGVAGIRWRALAVPGKPGPYSPHRESPVPGDNVALVMRDTRTQRSMVYAPGLGAMEETLWQAMQEAECVLVDGTFWTDEEMITLGLSRKRAREIGHLPQSGSGGMLEWLERLSPATRRILIHVNNTNPILDENSAERAELARRGIEVAWDGLELEV